MVWRRVVCVGASEDEFRGRCRRTLYDGVPRTGQGRGRREGASWSMGLELRLHGGCDVMNLGECLR